VIRQSLSTRDEAEGKRVLEERMSHGTSTADGAGRVERLAVRECSITTWAERLEGEGWPGGVRQGRHADRRSEDARHV
jgi:hypothetical protein